MRSEDIEQDGSLGRADAAVGTDVSSYTISGTGHFFAFMCVCGGSMQRKGEMDDPLSQGEDGQLCSQQHIFQHCSTGKFWSEWEVY